MFVVLDRTVNFIGNSMQWSGSHFFSLSSELPKGVCSWCTIFFKMKTCKKKILILESTLPLQKEKFVDQVFSWGNGTLCRVPLLFP